MPYCKISIRRIRILTNIEIAKVLPHRFPFLFIDKVTDREELKWARGYKNVSMNEWFINSENPRMPDILILEAIGQLGAFILPEKEDSLGLLTSVKNVNFLGNVYAGDRVDLYFEVIKLRKKALKGKGYASVEGKVVVEVEEIIAYYLTS